MRYPMLITLFCLLLAVIPARAGASGGYECAPTPEDEMGPFYRPGAPLQSVVGSGYVLHGTVRSAVDCEALKAALIEFWMAGPDGRYGDAYRAAVITGDSGRYRFESHYPGDYGSRPAHIHIRVSAEGFRPLTTQHYLQQGAREAAFDLVLEPRTAGDRTAQ